MTTQSKANPEVHLPHTRELPRDGDIRSAQDAHEPLGPELKARLREATDNGKAHIAEWKSGFEEGIRAQPIRSVLIAAAVGAVILFLFGRRA